MILRSERMIFIHIPKTGGTSVEYALIGDRCDFDRVDYEYLWGWCPDRRIWLQHASPQQLVDLDLVDRSELADSFVFAIVRNPFDRAVSAFHYLRRARGGFTSMLERSGPWHPRLAIPETPRYVGDHMRPQTDYLTLDGDPVLDHVGRFENLAESWAEVRNRVHDAPDLPHSNASRSRFEHYSQFYSDREVELVRKLYRTDLAAFDYAFDDRRTLSTRARRPIRRAILAADRVRRSLDYRIRQSGRGRIG